MKTKTEKYSLWCKSSEVSSYDIYLSSRTLESFAFPAGYCMLMSLLLQKKLIQEFTFWSSFLSFSSLYCMWIWQRKPNWLCPDLSLCFINSSCVLLMCEYYIYVPLCCCIWLYFVHDSYSLCNTMDTVFNITFQV